MGYKLLRFLRWASDASRPVLNKLGAALFTTDAKRLWISLASGGYIGADTPPIGATYIRFPGKSDPGTLWPNSTWSNISSEALLKGRALRIEGDYATGRGAAAYGSTQDDQVQGHYHEAGGFAGSGGAVTTYNQFASAQTTWARVSTDATYPQIRAPIADPSNGTPRIGNETRAANTTVQIWQRTA